MGKMFSEDAIKGSLIGIIPGAKGSSNKEKILDPLGLLTKQKAAAAPTVAAVDPQAQKKATDAANSDAAARNFADEEERRRRALQGAGATALGQAQGLGE